eukprot:4364071-Pyramimonas_sp.AAC.2
MGGKTPLPAAGQDQLTVNIAVAPQRQRQPATTAVSLPQRTNQTQEARVYSHDGPISLTASASSQSESSSHKPATLSVPQAVNRAGPWPGLLVPFP